MNTSGLVAVITILIVNTVIAFVIFILAFRKEKRIRTTWIMLSWFIFIVPLFGILYILIGTFIRYMKRKKEVDLTDVSFGQGREELILPPEKEIEMNYVPIQDAMAVSDTESLRRLLLDTLRNNAKRSISSISATLKSEDTEASHYAATIIVDALSEFRTTAQSMMDEMNRHPEDVEINLITLQYINEVLNMKIMTEVEHESYVSSLNAVAENLFKYNLWYMTATHYLWMTDQFLSIKNYSMAIQWVQRANQYRQGQLDTYKASLHLYFQQRDHDEFFRCLNEIKNADITVDKEILNLLRVFKN